MPGRRGHRIIAHVELVDMTLTKIMQIVFDAHALGVSVFSIAKPPDPIINR